ncbi:GDSL esterase/lipase-like protein [Tanacetum coccineum]
MTDSFNSYLVDIFLVTGKPKVPCYFIFGDSLVDSGNNNGLVTSVKANYPPYGIDFPQGVTGRFTNGRTIADILAELLEFDDYIPPYATATDEQISTGVNYASGGAGIRDETGSHLTLYDLGGRKIVVFGLGRIGCSPAEISIFGTDGEPCVEFINEAADLYNNNLKPIVDELNIQNLDAKFTFINVTSISSQQGLGLTNVPCCILRSDRQCAQTTSISPVRSLSMFYDGFHPTEAANTITARTSYRAISPMDASPFDISHLIGL